MNLELKYIGVTKLLSRLFNQGTCGLTPDGSDIEDVEQAMRDFQATFPGRFAVLRQGDQFHIEPINMAQAQDQGSVDMAAQALTIKTMREALEYASIGSCSCVTKTPDPEFHSTLCKYRIIQKALALPDNSTEILREWRDGQFGEPVVIDVPNYHHEAMGCGLEDRGIRDRYEAMEYGWNCAIERLMEQIPDEPLYRKPEIK